MTPTQRSVIIAVATLLLLTLAARSLADMWWSAMPTG